MMMPVWSVKSLNIAFILTASASTAGPVAVTCLPLNSPVRARARFVPAAADGALEAGACDAGACEAGACDAGADDVVLPPQADTTMAIAPKTVAIRNLTLSPP